MIPFLYINYDIIPFTFRVEYGKNNPQAHSLEYDWLGPEPM